MHNDGTALAARPFHIELGSGSVQGLLLGAPTNVDICLAKRFVSLTENAVHEMSNCQVEFRIPALHFQPHVVYSSNRAKLIIPGIEVTELARQIDKIH